jgi:Bifunctional DNA primase/polymerase, N-terminal
MKADTNAVREEACDYLQRKWPPIKLKPRSKEPPRGTHAANTITWDNVDKLTADDNIGVQFAESADLRDLDLDYQTAADLAKEVGLTDATAGFGRKSVGTGHLLYKAPGCEAKKFELPESDGYPKPLPMHAGKLSGLVLEIRGADNTYTMFPPSIHPETGETLEWNGSRREPLEITAGELRTLAGQHAVAAAALYFYPQNASDRYEVRMALSGALIQSGMKDERAKIYVQAVARLAGDPKWKEDFVKNTGRRLKDGKKASGIPKLVKFLQLSKACERVFREWLQIGNGPVRDDENVAKLNESYALVIVGDKTAIMKSGADGGIKFLTHSAFELWHANRFIYYQDKSGDQKKIFAESDSTSYNGPLISHLFSVPVRSGAPIACISSPHSIHKNDSFGC